MIRPSNNQCRARGTWPAGWGRGPLIQAIVIISLAIADRISAAVYRPDPPWPRGEIPYDFDGNVSSSRRDVARAAMRMWEDVATVNFRPAEFPELAWIHIRDSNDDLMKANYVGSVGFDGIGYGVGERKVNIKDWNAGTVAHELGHVLGLVHEQNRPDRDDFITIEWDHIEASLLNFNFYIDPFAKTYGGYDFRSIMQYTACAFSTCGNCSPTDAACRTITVLPPNESMQSVIGTNSVFSDGDKLIVSFLYPRPDWRFVDSRHDSPGPGTFLHPFDELDVALPTVPAGGTLWMQPGTYAVSSIIRQPVTLRAPLGGVTIR